ncbi:hypothetical protein LIER_02543 [Lithospermum erythrorhizon]|uniref:Uncharacterized protein n=1 Tax=Lithospermum erythrorhizon TaxID=34254 RepID=A0AAV3NQJ8_LITER
MAEQSTNRPSETSSTPQIIQTTHDEVRLARDVAEVGGVYSFNSVTHFSYLSTPTMYYSSRRIFLVPQGAINIDLHSSLPTPALESLHRQTMSETSEDFTVYVLRDSPEAHPAISSYSLDDFQTPLDVQPLSSRMGTPPPRPIVPKDSKGKSSKEPLPLKM